MHPDPLANPVDSSLLARFAQHFGLAPQPGSVESLIEIARAFATIPYENLSKIIRFAEAGAPINAKELPSEIIAGHLQWGTGGTCFSLTATLRQLVRSLGFDAEPILADRPYGPDTHCALRVDIHGQPHLLDPGYLIVEPIPIDAQISKVIDTSFNSISLTPQAAGGQLSLATREPSGWKTRLTFKTIPVDHREFLKAWDASFDWDMMHYPVLSRVMGNRQLYQRGLFEQIRSGLQIERREVPADQVVQRIATQFGIAPQVVERALKLLKRD